jgi:predicted phosphohydrolase
VYISGKDNSRADALSQRSDIAGTKEITKSTILKTYKDRSLGPLKELRRLKISIEIKVPEELQEVIIRQHYNNLVHRYSEVT